MAAHSRSAPATSLAGFVVLLVRGQVSISSHGGSAAFNRTLQRSLNDGRRIAAQEALVKKLMLAGLIALIGLTPLLALAQTQMQGDERMLVGRVQSVDDSGTELTLADGTKLLTPPGAMLRPGALEQGMLVVAMYREENGEKILTRLTLGESEPNPSATPGETPRRQQ
jgi:hypothetical protein